LTLSGGGWYSSFWIMKKDERSTTIKTSDKPPLTRIPGISYYNPPMEYVLEGRDGKVAIPLRGTPVPLEEEYYAKLGDSIPTYDAIGKGVYTALRNNPDCQYNEFYAGLLKEGYPHLVSELATYIVMLDKKDVDVPYLDRKINYLKIVGLMEPDNYRVPLEIGMAYLDKGLQLSALQFATVSLFRAEKYLARAVELQPDDLKAVYNLGEVSYILGKYDNATRLWKGLLDTELGSEQSRTLGRRLQKITDGNLSPVPAVDYLEVIATAFALFQQGEVEEAAALLLDVIDDPFFCDEFPIAELWYVLGLCYKQMAMPKYSEQYLREALKINPQCLEAEQALENLYS